MPTVLKKVFTIKVADKELELAVRVPTAAEKQKARVVHAKAWKEAVEGGVIMREALDRVLREQKLWDDLRQKEFDRLRSSILDGERKLKMGGNAGLTKKAAREIALSLGDWRDELSSLLRERNSVDSNTADAMADQAQFNYFVSVCTVYNETGKQYFVNALSLPSIDVYIDKSTEQVGLDAASKFAEIWYGTEEDSESKLPEVKFLQDYGFANAKGQLLNKEGKLVDRKDRLIDENGRFIDENGGLVDVDGRPVDDKGQYIVDFAPFLDDPDEPKVSEAVVEPKEEPKVEVKDSVEPEHKMEEVKKEEPAQPEE